MPNQIIPAYHNELRRLTALTGDSASTTAATVGVPNATTYLRIQARNLSTAVVVGVTLNPWLAVLKTQDSGVSFTDYSEASQDADTSTSIILDSQDTIANGDALYVGSHTPFRGVQVDVGAANGTASRTLTVKYWNGTVWTDISATDGTSGTTSLDQDGAVTWTVPSAWERARLEAILTGLVDEFHGTATPEGVPYVYDELYWTRWEWNGALDSEVEIDEFHALNRSTNYMPMVSGEIYEQAANGGPGGFGAVEFVTDAGTANLMVSAGSGGGRF